MKKLISVLMSLIPFLPIAAKAQNSEIEGLARVLVSRGALKISGHFKLHHDADLLMLMKAVAAKNKVYQEPVLIIENDKVTIADEVELFTIAADTQQTYTSI